MLISAFQTHDEPVGKYLFGCGDAFLIACIGLSVTDVFHYGSLEEEGILHKNTHLFSEGVDGAVSHINIIDHDSSCIHIIESCQHVDDCRLSGSGGTNKCNGLSGLYMKIEVFKYIIVIFICKGHIVEINLSFCVFEHHGILPVFDNGRVIDGIEDLLKIGTHFGKVLYDIGDLL